jgi:glycosyltransferase involved in cell wall biosynthesis
VVFYSRALLERGRELGVPLPRASVVYPPVTDDFRPLSADRRREIRRRHGVSDGLLLLNVKRLHPLADHETLLRAMAHIASRCPDATLVVVGGGEREQGLRARAAELGLRDAVRFLGPVPNADVAELQGAADLFVLSSLLEAMPTVALEALASGTPVVSTDNPGGTELHGLFAEDVVVVPRGDAEALARAVLDFAVAPRRARAGVARVIDERFRLPGVVQQYLALYRESGPA